ncbi:MAG: nucleoside hydrolase, partial [Gammaproteobacteria bacterium]|nr:nucleoside hydrolase [Gammaproteobacteria bacterium]
MKQRIVILDTDIGGDADDAFALLFALNSSELDVAMVITNDEHRCHRAQFATLFLQVGQWQVPVFAGADRGHKKYCVIHGLLEPG